jgi:membrane protein YdbS with pleckstrin-like domain
MNETEKYPPFTQLAMLSLALIVAGGIYLSAHLPKHVPLAPAVILLVLAAAIMLFNLGSLARVKHFDWERFWQVSRWSLLAYVVIAALIGYVFLQNHLSGGPLVVLMLSLVVFAVHVPALVGFTVARYASSPQPEAI